jgi:hypothetical protein
VQVPAVSQPRDGPLVITPKLRDVYVSLAFLDPGMADTQELGMLKG